MNSNLMMEVVESHCCWSLTEFSTRDSTWQCTTLLQYLREMVGFEPIVFHTVSEVPIYPSPFLSIFIIYPAYLPDYPSKPLMPFETQSFLRLTTHLQNQMWISGLANVHERRLPLTIT